jgi:hypothetical protein
MSVSKETAIDAYKRAFFDLSKNDGDIESYINEMKGTWPGDELSTYDDKLSVEAKREWMMRLTKPEHLGGQKTPKRIDSILQEQDLVDGNTGTVSEASAHMHLVEENDLARKVMEVIFGKGGIGVNRNVKEWAAALTILNSNAQQLEAGKMMGEARVIGDSLFQQWKDSNNKGILNVGAYMLQKYSQQGGLDYKFWEDPKEGSWSEWRRYGQSMCADGRFVMYCGTRENKADYDPNAFEIYLKDFKIGNKSIRYTPIPKWAYEYAMLFVCYYEVKAKDGKINVSVKMKDTPKVSENIIKFLEAKKHVLQDSVLVITDADWVLETIAKQMTSSGVNTEIDAYFKSAQKGIQLAYSKWETSLAEVAVLDGGSYMDTAVLKQGKLSALGGTVDIDLACNQLKAARDSYRNKTQVAQLVNKNVGSVAGDTALPFVDTRLKGRRMLELARELGYKNQDCHMYGVAYNHMEPEFKAMGCKVSYHDIKMATKGVADTEWGDIFTSNGEYIFDDTLVTTAPPEMGKMTQVFTPDHAKLKHFMSLKRSKLIISKIDLDHFRKPDQISELLRIVENINDPSFKHVQMVKLGKLHNTEAFMVLSNLGTDRFPKKEEGRKPMSVLRGDLAQMAMVISLANEIIQKSQAYGIRARKDGKDNGSMSRMWRLLVSALPTTWGWYTPNKKEGKGLTSMTGGSSTNITYIPETELYGASAFNFSYDSKSRIADY